MFGTVICDEARSHAKPAYHIMQYPGEYRTIQDATEDATDDIQALTGAETRKMYATRPPGPD